MAYYTLFLLFMINLVNYIDRYILSGVLPLIKLDFQLTDQQCGLLMPAFMIVYMLISPLFGWIGDRFSRRIIIASGIGLWSLATVGAAFTRNFSQLFATRTLVGVGEAGYGTVSPGVISDLFPVSSRGRALSFFYLAIPVGSALGYVLGGQIGVNYGWPWAFFIMGLPGLLLAVLMLGTVEPLRGQSEGISHQLEQVSWRDYGQFFHNRSYITTSLGMAAMTFAMGGLAHWMPTYFERCRGIGLERATFLFGMITVAAGILGTFTGGWLGDYFQQKHRGAYFLVCGGGMLLGTPFALVAFLANNPMVYWPAIFICEFFIFLNTGPGNAILINVVMPNMRAAAVALNIFVIHALGDAFSPVVIGTLSDMFRQQARHNGMSAAHAAVCGLDKAMLIMPVTMTISGLIFLYGARHLGHDMDRVKAQVQQACER